MLCPTEKKWRLFRAWTSRHPLWCAWQVTYRCNFRCRFCHYWQDPAGIRPPGGLLHDLTTARHEPSVCEYELGAKKLAAYGTLLISLAGGEPLLRTDLPAIVEAIGRYHFPFVTTNGWFITEQAARDLMRAGVWGVSVSIDYADPARHDARRGMDGAWAQAWKAVEFLAAARVHKFQRVNVIAVLMEDNIDQMEPLLEMAAAREAYFMVQPYGILKTGSKAYIHDNGAVSPQLLELRQRWKNFLSNPYYLKRFDKFLTGGIGGCRAGKAFFNIDSTGDIAICVERRHIPVANLHRHSSQAIHKLLQAASRTNRCKSCWYNCRGEVESLYSLGGLFRSLPTLLFDRGKAPTPGNSQSSF